MHPYTVKNWLWAVIISMYIVIALLSGCASSPQTKPVKQYCYTSQEIRTKNGSNVSSETLVKCNDDPVEQVVIKKAGLAQNCGQVSNFININGRLIDEPYIACQDLRGKWFRLDMQ